MDVAVEVLNEIYLFMNKCVIYKFIQLGPWT